MHMAKMQAMRSKVEQCNQDLTEERERIAKLLEENDELRLTQGVEIGHHHWADETQQRTEQERKEIEGRLARAMEDQSFSEELLSAEQERSDELSKVLRALQEQRRITEKI